MPKENKPLSEKKIIICESCGTVIGEEEDMKSYRKTNPIMRFACPNCKHKTDTKNPYFDY